MYPSCVDIWLNWGTSGEVIQIVKVRNVIDVYTILEGISTLIKHCYPVVQAEGQEKIHVSPHNAIRLLHLPCRTEKWPIFRADKNELESICKLQLGTKSISPLPSDDAECIIK